MGILNEIVSKKKERLKDIKGRHPLRDLRTRANDCERTRDFKASIKRLPEENIKLIAEIKKASPSRGIIRKDFDHLMIARLYEEKGVHAVSILTEEDYFHGSITYLQDIRNIFTKPVLRKDFICDEYQIYESRVCGSDAILLIAAVLEKNQASDYIHIARDLGLSVLFEVHNFRELEMALHIESDIIGINNRDLKTLQVDINTTFNLIKEIPKQKIIVSESGIKTRSDMRNLEDAGVDAVLIGTAFMEAEDTAKKIDELMGII